MLIKLLDILIYNFKIIKIPMIYLDLDNNLIKKLYLFKVIAINIHSVVL